MMGLPKTELLTGDDFLEPCVDCSFSNLEFGDIDLRAYNSNVGN